MTEEKASLQLRRVKPEGVVMSAAHDDEDWIDDDEEELSSEEHFATQLAAVVFDWHRSLRPLRSTKLTDKVWMSRVEGAEPPSVRA
jgi:hypothetical protein